VLLADALRGLQLQTFNWNTTVRCHVSHTSRGNQIFGRHWRSAKVRMEHLAASVQSVLHSNPGVLSEHLHAPAGPYSIRCCSSICQPRALRPTLPTTSHHTTLISTYSSSRDHVHDLHLMMWTRVSTFSFGGRGPKTQETRHSGSWIYIRCDGAVFPCQMIIR
jgi:hypothetical protein